jgi:microcystin-dependent protein
MTLYKWSQTASADAAADSTINWAEGQAPSSVNDSARAMMAATAKYRDDIAGAIVTSGTSTAYMVSSNQVFDTLADLGGQMIAFTPHTGNGATVTLNVDSLGAKPLRSAPNTELLAGTIIQGTPYVATYNNSDGAFYLQGFFGNPYNIPLGGMLPYLGSTAPNTSFVLPFGQALSRTTYAGLFSLIGTTYGAGNGSTTFNVIDLRGRIPVPQDNMGGTAAGRVTVGASGLDGTMVGANGGAQIVTIAENQLPNIVPTFTGNLLTVNSINNNILVSVTTVPVGGSGNAAYVGTPVGTLQSQGTPTGTVSSINGGVAQQPTNNMPPSIVVPYILRIV